MDKKNITSLEELITNLSNIYESLGYRKYKMSKFEEYDFYIDNKSFLKSKNIITFNDLNGKLMALKPDVTLSIVKNSTNQTQKLYYTENIYRVKSEQYKEIMQVGLEYMGNVDTYVTSEIIGLAWKSLNAISDKFVLDISHMGLIIGFLDELNLSPTDYEQMLNFISKKDAHEINTLCNRINISQQTTDKIIKIATCYGGFEQMLPICNELIINDKTKNAVDELNQLYNILTFMGISDKISLDFSIINDMSYYNGIIFQGFIDGVTGTVLSGGRYDNLLAKMNKSIGAIGFAVYTDMLEYMISGNRASDVDVMLMYSNDTAPLSIAAKVKELTDGGLTVFAAESIPENLKYKLLLKIEAKGDETVEGND